MKIMPINYNYVNQTNQRHKTQKLQSFTGAIRAVGEGAPRSKFKDLIENLKNEIVETVNCPVDTEMQFIDSNSLAYLDFHDDYNNLIEPIVKKYDDACEKAKNNIILLFIP